MSTKKCSGECGEIKPVSEFYSKGSECRECTKKKRRDNNKANGKIRYIAPEIREIQEKYKNDPEEMQRQLNNAKAKRARERKKDSHLKGTAKKITEKVCNGNLCKGMMLPVEKFSTQNYGDGYQTFCKECTKYNNTKKSASYENIDLENVTKSCKNVDCPCDNPQQLMQFDKHPNYEFGRNDICKTCRAISRRENKHEAITEGKKLCAYHNIYHDVSDFFKDSYNKDRLDSSCKARRIVEKNMSNSKYPVAINKLIKDAQKNAKKRSIKFAITSKDIDELYKTQDGKCAMTGIQMTHDYMTERKEDDHHIINPTNMSIDRIHNSKGYTKNNIQLVCAIINRIKHNMNPFELMFFVITVGNNKIRKQALEIGLLDEEPIFLTPEMSKRIEQKYKYTISNAKNRNLNVNITHEDLNNLYIKQNGKCAITGQILTCDKSLCDISVDRIESNKHYILDNIQLVLDSANQKKGDLNNVELENWSNTVIESHFLLKQLLSI